MSFQVFPADPIRRVELALDELRAGRMVILVDDEDRENEGDLVLAGEKVTPEAINFMATHARGLICLAIPPSQVQRLGLPMMAANNGSAYGTAFTVSVEAREGVTTGISAADRARTIEVAIDPESTGADIVTPGHIFPLRAREGGVLERVGQTEGSVDLARLAGLNPSGVICEIMREDGTMARMPDLMEFGEQHQLLIVTVADLIKFRMRNERVVAREAEGEIEVEGLGVFKTRLYHSLRNEGMHMTLSLGDVAGAEKPLVRVQPSPPAWSAFMDGGTRFSAQARASLERIHQEGTGAVVFLHLNGGGLDQLAGLWRSDVLGESGPPQRLQAEALRDLGTGCQILVDLGVSELRLLTDSSRPIVGLEAYGLKISERVSLLGEG